jgi:ATP-dependent exoDNAse (exonuclease V) beta subunit
MTGYIDLVAFTGDDGVIVDFKTDRAPSEPARDSHPGYVAQVEAYARMLAAAETVSAEKIRRGLLWTETGKLEWL